MVISYEIYETSFINFISNDNKSFFFIIIQVSGFGSSQFTNSVEMTLKKCLYPNPPGPREINGISSASAAEL